MTKINLKFLMVCFCLYQAAFATKYAGDFEELGVSARAIGLGGAYVAVTSDPSAIYYNPANSVLTKDYSVLLMHAESFGGMVKNNYLGIVLPTRKQSFGLGILNNDVPAIKLTTLPDTTQPPSDSNQPILDRQINAAQWVFYFNYSHRLSSILHLGINTKLIYQTYGIASCFGMGIDLGGSVALADGLELGLRIRNLTSSPLFWDNKTRESISPRIALGLARTFNFGRDHLLLSAELENNSDAGLDNLQFSENFGIEYSIKQVLAARLGLYHRLITLGLGINYKRLFIDYAYQTGYFNQSRDLGSSQKISGGLKF
jgi:hypothetical protein